MNLEERLTELSRIHVVESPVVSVYLNTRWKDEHQRERVRVFLKNELRQAREGAASRGLHADLDWVEAQGALLIDQAAFPDAHGAALFACHAVGLREVWPVRTPFEDAFVVGDHPFLRPLAEVADVVPDTLVVFVDGRRARLIPLASDGAGEEVVLESDVPGRHRHGGWLMLAQSRYQRHIQDHRGRHFEAVADTLGRLVEADGVQRIVLAGDVRSVHVFREHLPRPLADRVAGDVRAAWHEPKAVLTERAAALLERVAREATAAALDDVLTLAAKSGRAVSGVAPTLEAVGQGAVHKLFLLKALRAPGVACGRCGVMRPGQVEACPICGQPATAVELGEAMVARVVELGGSVETVGAHQGLAEAGGVAALLRYPR